MATWESSDAFWRAIGGDAWKAWLEATGRTEDGA